MDEAEKATPEMIEAGVNAFHLTETLSVRRLLEVAYPAMRAAARASTPAPSSLPDVGELIRELRSWPAVEQGDALSAGFVAGLMERAADALAALATDGSENER